MNEISPLAVDLTRMDLIEINNNLAFRKKRKSSQVSISSVSSCQSDSSEEYHVLLERETSLQDVIDKTEDKKIRAEYRRCRSLSDGGTGKLRNDDCNFDAFPSLPNSVLERMGLRGLSLQRERLSEEEVEQKFTSLALAFAIDAATIKDRCERLRRSRDQTETNLATEIERLKEKLALLQPLCTDYETVELLSTLLSQVDKVVSASSLVSISVERFGSVQHEERLTESVQLMVSHVQMLKQQRDSARRQLQYTKRVLQNPVELPAGSPTTPSKTLLSPNGTSRKVTCRRRASIATFSQPQIDKPLMDKKIMRRPSELSLRATSINRNIRPNRLELMGDLVKIKEGFVDETAAMHDENIDHLEDNESDDENQATEINSSHHSSPDEPELPLDFVNLSIREKIKYRFKKIERDVQEKYNNWTADGTIHEICCFCALLCFSISLITMVNILVEYEYAKRGWGTSHFFWSRAESYNDEKYSSIRQ
ncbi:uncharacterized protein LOC108917035 [Anoplophora glabripennis]|uniref:uncharacterized protein LOC108917035 n=1 Tax=Anoplophora glabripennis TaxID=217634 RepID=UPI000C767FDC|nr:uncharacterized protein LOC108917035 [Anoplophora glabripennis]